MAALEDRIRELCAQAVAAKDEAALHLSACSRQSTKAA
jgi:hypothetical protein